MKKVTNRLAIMTVAGFSAIVFSSCASKSEPAPTKCANGCSCVEKCDKADGKSCCETCKAH